LPEIVRWRGRGAALGCGLLQDIVRPVRAAVGASRCCDAVRHDRIRSEGRPALLPPGRPGGPAVEAGRAFGIRRPPPDGRPLGPTCWGLVLRDRLQPDPATAWWTGHPLKPDRSSHLTRLGRSLAALQRIQQRTPRSGNRRTVRLMIGLSLPVTASALDPRGARTSTDGRRRMRTASLLGLVSTLPLG
jgi:hypothetical protein